jgi:inner membrane protein
MTAPTHAAFGLLCAAIANTNQPYAIACALGALLPDIDHPQSAIGRVLFFISYPLNRAFGHRKLIHGFGLWGGLFAVGVFTGSTMVQWVAFGAISHVLIDTYTIGGVQALLPFSERSVVCFKRDWRIYTASTHEILLFLVIFGCIYAANYSHVIGGPRKLINLMARSHKITTEEYTRAGLTYCMIKGQFRWNNGRIEEAIWPVVGLEGTRLVYWNQERLIKDGQHGTFIRSILQQTEDEWPVVKVDGLCTVRERSFWFDSRHWYMAKPGDTAMGTIKAASGGIPQIRSQTDG